MESSFGHSIEGESFGLSGLQRPKLIHCSNVGAVPNILIVDLVAFSKPFALCRVLEDLTSWFV